MQSAYLLILTVLSVVACTSSTLFGQETLVVRPIRAATPDTPTIDILIMGRFNTATDFAFAGARWDMEAAEGRFIQGYCLDGICEPPPMPDGRRILNMFGGQLHLPIAGILGDPSNPMPTTIAEWRTDDFMPRDALVVTFNTRAFDVYIDESSGASESRLDTFEEGAGVIRVRRCYTDCDGDDAATVFDFLCFFNAFQAGDFYADCDESGELDLFDFLCFQQEFIAGCP